MANTKEQIRKGNTIALIIGLVAIALLIVYWIYS